MPWRGRTIDEGQRLSGLFGQVLITISAILTIIFSLVMFFPIRPDSPILFSVIQTPPFGLPILDLYLGDPYIFWDGIRPHRWWNLEESWYRLTSGSSFLGILNSSIFFTSIMITTISISRTVRDSGENSEATAGAKRLFKGAFAASCIAYLLNIQSHVLSLRMYTYSHGAAWAYFVGFSKFTTFNHYYLNGLGWALLILQNIFGVAMMVLVGAFFKCVASRIQKSSLRTRRLWSVIGKTYIMLGGMTGFTIFVALIAVNMTFLVPIMVILSGAVGVAGFIKFRPTMLLAMIGTTGSMRNTTGAITGAIYDMEALAKEIELESSTNDGSRFIIISETKCPDCNYENPCDAEFCIECGQRLR